MASGYKPPDFTARSDSPSPSPDQGTPPAPMPEVSPGDGEQLFVNQSGQIVPLAPSQANWAGAMSLVPASPKQIADYQASKAYAEKYGSGWGPVKAFGLGAARSLSLGLSDAALTGTGLMSAEDVQGYGAENPFASGAGSFAGAVAPLLLTGGGSAAVEGAEGIAGAAGAAEAAGRAGEAAPGVLRRLAGMTGPSLVARAGEATEGRALLGAGTADRLAQQAAETGGFTWDVAGHAAPTQGFAFSAQKGAERVVGPQLTGSDIRAYVQQHLDALKGGGDIGAWKADAGPNAGRYVLDVSKVAGNKAQALTDAQAARQDAIFDLGKMEGTPVSPATIAAAKAAGETVDVPPAASPLAQIVRKALAKGAGSAVEGLAYGAGNVVSEKALGDPNLTAQSAVSQIALSGLLGFGLGAGGSAVWNLGREAMPDIGAARTNEWLAQTEADANAKAAAGGANISAALDKLARQHGKSSLNQILRDGRNPEMFDPPLVGFGTGPTTTVERAQDVMNTVGPKIDQAAQRIDQMMKPEEAPNFMALRDQVQKNIIDPIATEPWAESTVAKLSAGLDHYQQQFQDSGGAMSVSDLLDMRRGIKKQLFGLRGDQTPDASLFKTGLQSWYRTVNDTIDSTISGVDALDKDALQQWKDLNYRVAVAATYKTLAKVGAKKSSGGSMFSLGEQGWGMAGTLLGGAADFAGPMIGSALGSEEGGEDLAEVAPDLFERLAEGGIGAAAMLLGARYLGRHGSAIVGAGSKALREALERGATGGAEGGGMGLGRALAVGAAMATSATAAKVVRSATQDGALQNLVNTSADIYSQDRQASGQPNYTPDQTFAPIEQDPEKVALLAHLERMNRGVDDQIQTGAGNIIRGSSRGETPSQGEAMAGVDRDFGQAPDRSEGTFKKRIQQVQTLSSNPSALNDLLDRQIQDWAEHAPDTAQALNAHTIRTVQFLASKVPAQPILTPLDREWTPNRDDVATFTRYWDAVDNPLGVLKQANAGNLTPEAAESVQAVFPHLFAKMQGALMDHLTARPNVQVPYAQRMMLSSLLGQDMDGTMNPGLVALAQTTYAGPGPAPPPAPTRGKKPGQTKFTLSDRMETDQQAASSRGEEIV